MPKDSRRRASFGRPSKDRARKRDGSPNWAGRIKRGQKFVRAK
jgi:hypothetical protein